MKPKELLYSLDHVGEDLLAEAEQTVLVRKHRPWAGAAAAAVVLVALGAGGFFLWKHLQGGTVPAATGEGPQTVTMPNVDPNAPSTEPDRLTVGDCWTGVSRVRFDDLDRSLAGSLAADYEDLTNLPVYRREAGPLGDLDHLYTDEELHARLQGAADALDLRLTGDVMEGRDDRSGYPDHLQIQTDQGMLTVTGDGRITLLYDEEHVYEAHVKVELAAGLTPEETERAIRNEQMSACGEELARRLGLGECGFVTCDRWEPASSAWTVFTLYPLREDPAQQLVSRWFEGVQMLTNDGKTLRGFVLDRLPGETDAEAPEGLRLAGTYPIRTEAEAVEALLNGSGLCEEALVQDDLNGDSLAATLVYLPEAGHELLMPFYRFWLPAGAEADGDEYLAVYVPAVTDACLADWPMKEEAEDGPDPTEAPTEPDDPQPTETGPEPTEPPDGYQPMLVNLENGRVGVAGPAGTVEALYYMGDCQGPVWADLDGDGFRELIYWCHGPTSGLFTVGICVYGLEEGWPVLRASQICCLDYCEPSLSVEDGTVYFHHALRHFDAEQGEFVSDGERRETVSVKGGKLLLNGGSLPEGIREWGGPEYGWFGSSFSALKAEVKDACTLNHWVALVWTEPTAASAPTAGPNVYAAVTDNSHTVTGLLRYVPQQDGTWICAMQGIEPIEAPADPDSLVGLTPEQVTERLGPCHFDMGSGLYIPCWFTEDCRMLTVHGMDVVEDVELKDLAPRPLSTLALDPLDPSADVGIGIFLLRNDAELVVFYNYFGLFAFDGTSGELLFAVDLDKAVERQGHMEIQGGGSGTGCRISEDGKTLLVVYYDADAGRYSDVCVIDLENRTCQNTSSIPLDFTAASTEELNEGTWDWDSSILSDLWIRHNGGKWYPFRTN